MPKPLPRTALTRGLTLAAFTMVAVLSTATAQDGPRLAGSWETVANGDDVTALARADDGRMWAGTASGGVVLWEGSRVVAQYLGPQDGLPCNDVRDIVRWRGVWWFATCKGLAAYDPARDRMEFVPADLASENLTALAVDGQDRLWVGTGEWWDPAVSTPGAPVTGGWRPGGLSVTTDGRTWAEPGDPASWPSRNVADLAVWHGAVWVAAMPHQAWVPSTNEGTSPGRWDGVGGGVGRFEADHWTVSGPETVGALAAAVTSAAAGTDAVWFGTAGRGLISHDGVRWTGYRDCGDPVRCIPDDYVADVAVGPDGAVWVGTRRFNGRGTGLALLDTRGTAANPDDDAWHAYLRTDGLAGDLVSAILPGETDADTWLGTSDLDPADHRHGRGLVHLLDDRQTMEVHTTIDQPGGALPDNLVTATAWDPAAGRLWVGTDGGGLAEWRPADGWRTHTRASTSGGLGSNSIADVAVAPDGTVWVATREATVDAQGRGWSDGGLSRFDGTGWRVFTTADGLPSNHLSAVALDGRGKVWAGTGATRFGPKELRYRGNGVAVLDAATGRWERTFTFPALTSNNVSAIAVRGAEVWVSTAYFFYVDPRPGGAQFHTGGGLSVYDLDAGRWRTYTEEDGLTPSFQQRGLGSGKPLLDLRAILLTAAGGVLAGGGGYPDARFVDGVALDGTLDEVGPSGVAPTRFNASGPIADMAEDAAGNVWTVTSGGGLRVRVGDQWLVGDRSVGRLPSDDLTTITADSPEPWVGTAGRGLARLVPPPTAIPPAVPTDSVDPTATAVVFQQFTEQIYVPRVLRQRLPVPVKLPRD